MPRHGNRNDLHADVLREKAPKQTPICYDPYLKDFQNRALIFGNPSVASSSSPHETEEQPEFRCKPETDDDQSVG